MNVELPYPFKTREFLGIRDNFSLIKDVRSNLLFENSEILQPSISVVIPTFKAPYLLQAIESVNAQENAPSFEVVIVDNDPDADIETMKQFLGDKKHIYRYFRNERNIGMAGNWNRCIELASSENIVFLHSDDTMSKECLKKLWNIRKCIESTAAILGHENFMNAEGIVFQQYSCREKILFLKLKPYYKYTKYSQFIMEYDNGCCEMINKSVAIKIGGFDDNVYPSIDGQFFAKYHEEAPIYRAGIVVRCCRVAVNVSKTVVHSYRACNYYMKIAVIDKHFNGNRFLKYIAKLEAKNAYFPMFGDTNKKYSLRWYERFILYFNIKLYRFFMRFPSFTRPVNWIHL